MSLRCQAPTTTLKLQNDVRATLTVKVTKRVSLSINNDKKLSKLLRVDERTQEAHFLHNVISSRIKF